MNSVTKHFLAGYGSVLRLYTPGVESLSRLRETRFPVRRRLSPLANAKTRRTKAEVIRNALEHMALSSAKLERDIQALVERSRPAGKHHYGVDSHPGLTVGFQPSERRPSPSSGTLPSDSNHVEELADLLAIRGDGEKVFRDLVSAEKSLTRE
ncbi:MAG: hypothetical protein LGR52_13105 [Candidatus Thiosymbion ectosymbiont of Robbea hypermnestra]|nr:hypothetical protein [Candidatus Thiosymbion ectosymbiont of Robbea hypermnestra]